MEADSFANRKQALSHLNVEPRTLNMPCAYFGGSPFYFASDIYRCKAEKRSHLGRSEALHSWLSVKIIFQQYFKSMTFALSVQMSYFFYDFATTLK